MARNLTKTETPDETPEVTPQVPATVPPAEEQTGATVYAIDNGATRIDR